MFLFFYFPVYYTVSYSGGSSFQSKLYRNILLNTLFKKQVALLELDFIALSTRVPPWISLDIPADTLETLHQRYPQIFERSPFIADTPQYALPYDRIGLIREGFSPFLQPPEANYIRQHHFGRQFSEDCLTPQNGESVITPKLATSGRTFSTATLARGGQGFVASTSDPDVVLKTMTPTQSPTETIDRILLALSLSGVPGVAQIKSVYLDDSHPPKVRTTMQRVQGQNLHSLRSNIAHSPVNNRIAFIYEIMTQAAQSLQVMKALGIIYCDLKPENIMWGTIEGDPTPRLYMVDLDMLYLRGTPNTINGTSSYASPEQLLIMTAERGFPHPHYATGQQHLTTQSDVFNLGLIAYELFMGRPLFPHQQDFISTCIATYSTQYFNHQNYDLFLMNLYLGAHFVPGYPVVDHFFRLIADMLTFYPGHRPPPNAILNYIARARQSTF